MLSFSSSKYGYFTTSYSHWNISSEVHSRLTLRGLSIAPLVMPSEANLDTPRDVPTLKPSYSLNLEESSTTITVLSNKPSNS